MATLFGAWSQPLSNSVGVPLSHRYGYMGIGFSKPVFEQRPDRRRVQRPENRMGTRMRMQRARAQSRWRWLPLLMRTSRSVAPRPQEHAAYNCVSSFVSQDFQELWPHFSLPEAERAALDFELLEMIQATFYAMLLNDAVELGIVGVFMADGLKSTLVVLGWMREPSDSGLLPLLSNYHSLCPRFDLEVATQYAPDSHISEMVQIIFYAMVINDAARLGLSRRSAMDCVLWAIGSWTGALLRRGSGKMIGLRRAQASRPVIPPSFPALAAGPPGEGTTSFPVFRDTTHVAEYARDNLRWSVRESSSFHSKLLPLHFEVYCPDFDHIMAMQFAHATYILEMVQAIFYAMVIGVETYSQRDLGKPDAGPARAEMRYHREVAAVYRRQAQRRSDPPPS
ncbi:hypothetical protein Cgig2_021805 [Carnegiea gigantea]|uniref:Uncharacterized protein n=1 Tax=Carnegiea gigantea TaxID=171969 RepID=A0A9Q1K8M5_9CARY|nr:hypothetical protein Cgig2_021805 [Carnegiea gigantea]